MNQEALMKLCKCGWIVSAFDLINHGFVIIGKAFKDEIYLIFMLYGFAKDGQLIKTSCNPLKVGINCFVFLAPAFELCLQLLDMTPAWFGIGKSQRVPNFGGSGCTRDQRLKRW
ncbi:unnamed protein product [Microthlaspi erraticum]|uniref:Uncharacterized protein n=1 Tax=Microthlaspi erraticum TaxID=1685480 RepID=A0A6D2J966_9BRAS|nr:unnamed protein product [Microthlaspi erraticum]